MLNETRHILSDGSADSAIIKFTTVAQMSAFCLHTRSKALTPLVNCIVNDTVIHAMPNVQQTLLQFVNAVHLQLMHSLLDVTPYLVIDRIEVSAVAVDRRRCHRRLDVPVSPKAW